MKKKNIFILLICLVLLAGCDKKENLKKDNNNKDNNVTDSISLKDPDVLWCQLYNPNGFDTITCVISNPNKVDIDITYDLVFYKDGIEVSRQEGWSNFQISPKHNEIIWGNTNIPKASDVDEVKMENILVSKAYHDSIDAQIKYIKTIDDEAYFSIKHDQKPNLTNITFLLYNDDNKNGKCDNGELVVTEITNTTEKEDEISFPTDVYNYTDYEIYYNSY